jgi:uncharacterized protein YndB with AHSA1/START domain
MEPIMSEISITAEGRVGAPAEKVYAYLADYRQHHPRILPPAFSDFAVEEGGVGAGTIIRFKLTVGGRTLQYRQRVEEPVPGRVLTESNDDGSGVTTFTVTPDGDGSRVRIETKAPSRGGVSGFIERFLAPRLLQPLYNDELARLDRYARERATA